MDRSPRYRSPRRELSEHREGVNLKKMFPLSIDRGLLSDQDIILSQDVLQKPWYKELLEEAGPAGLDDHTKIKWATCFYVQDWITKILDIMDYGEITIVCNPKTKNGPLECDTVSMYHYNFKLPNPSVTGYFQIRIDAPARQQFSHESAGFFREGKAIVYDGARWASDPEIQRTLADFFGRQGIDTEFIMESHQRITGNCPTFQPVGIFLMLIHGVDNFLSAMAKLGDDQKNQLIETTALRMKNLMEGPESALLPLNVGPLSHRLPALPRDYQLLDFDPRNFPLPHLPEDPLPPLPPRRSSLTQEEIDNGWASPLSLSYTRKTSPKRKRKTYPKRKRKTSPKRKRKTSPKRKTSQRKKR